MISKETASKIWTAYHEIDKANELMSEMKKELERTGNPNIKDVFGDKKGLQLGVPSGRDCYTLLGVRIDLAVKIIEEHIKDKKKY